MPRPVAEVVELLTAWLGLARRGELQELFLLARRDDGEWIDDYNVSDRSDLVLELRTAVIRTQCDEARDTLTEH